MQAQSHVIDLLQEIESVTDINGCFLMRLTDQSIIESTIPVKIHSDILWEIMVLRETFQQFSSGVKHGELGEIILEGERGFIYLFNLPPHFLLIARSSKEIRLAVIKLGLIDIIRRIKKRLDKNLEDLLAIAAGEFEAVGGIEAAAYSSFGPSPISSSSASKAEKVSSPAAKSPVEAQPVPATAPVTPAAPAKIVTPATPVTKSPVETPSVPATPATPATPTTPVSPTPGKSSSVGPQQAVKLTPAPVGTSTSAPASTSASAPQRAVQLAHVPTQDVAISKVDSSALFESIKSMAGTSKIRASHVVGKVLDELKTGASGITGTEMAKILEALKDSILENIGTSLALFDISRAARELKSVSNVLSPSEVTSFQGRVDQWAQRLVKK